MKSGKPRRRLRPLKAIVLHWLGDGVQFCFKAPPIEKFGQQKADGFGSVVQDHLPDGEQFSCWTRDYVYIYIYIHIGTVKNFNNI